MHAEYKPDAHTGKKIHAYVSDSCADQNYWCSKDTNHLDLSQAYLESMGMDQGWNGRKVDWRFISGPPAGCVPSFLRELFRSPHVSNRSLKGLQ
jgi:hypothetical protein